MSTDGDVPEAALDPRLDALVRRLVHEAIDLGARCQKAGSFLSAAPGEPTRAIHDVAGDQAVARVKEIMIDG